MSNDRFFNLLKPIKEPKSSWDKIYDWILGRARIVLLTVEIIMVLIFFSKVIVDNTAKNRKQEFEKLQLELLSLENKHQDEFKKVQEKVLGYSEVWDYTNNFYPVVTEVLGYVGNPSDEFSLVLSQSGTLQINGYESISVIKDIEAKMKASKTFTNVVVDTLTLEQTDVLEQKGRFTITAFLDKSKFTRDALDL